MQYETLAPIIAKFGAFPAQIIKITTSQELVIDRGKDYGIRTGQRVLVYDPDGEEIIDPKTGKVLSILEQSRGCGKIFSVAENYSLIKLFQSDAKNINAIRIGDFVKPI